MTPEEHAKRILALGVDIAELRKGTTGYASPEEQGFRLSPENVGQTAAAGMTLREDQISPGASSDLTSSDFADRFFNNLPFLLDRTSEGSLIRDAQDRAGIIPLDQEVAEGGTVLDLWAGEALALHERAMRGEASRDELELLEVYNEFFAGRTGM